MKRLSRQEALNELVRLNDEGIHTQDELVAIIGKEWFNDFRQLCYISVGIGIAGRDIISTYSVTELGRKEKDFATFEPSERDKRLARFIAEYL